MAKAWKEAFIQNVITRDPPTFGSYNEFLENVHKVFTATDIEGDAQATLQQLCQGNRTVDNYILQFRILSGRAKIIDNTTLIEYFMEGLNFGILQKNFSQPTTPK